MPTRKSPPGLGEPAPPPAEEDGDDEPPPQAASSGAAVNAAPAPIAPCTICLRVYPRWIGSLSPDMGGSPLGTTAWSAVANGALRGDSPLGGADDTFSVLGRSNAKELGRRGRDAGGIEAVVAVQVGGWADQPVLVEHAVAQQRHSRAGVGERLRDGAAEAAQHVVLLDRHQPSAVSGRAGDRRVVERLHGVHVDHANVEAIRPP